jgi:hypothetical protein
MKKFDARVIDSLHAMARDRLDENLVAKKYIKMRVTPL